MKNNNLNYMDKISHIIKNGCGYCTFKGVFEYWLLKHLRFNSLEIYFDDKGKAYCDKWCFDNMKEDGEQHNEK